MNTYHLSRVRKMFCHELAPLSIQRHNMKAWVRSVRRLGDKWLLRGMVERKGDST